MRVQRVQRGDHCVALRIRRHGAELRGAPPAVVQKAIIEDPHAHQRQLGIAGALEHRKGSPQKQQLRNHRVAPVALRHGADLLRAAPLPLHKAPGEGRLPEHFDFGEREHSAGRLADADRIAHGITAEREGAGEPDVRGLPSATHPSTRGGQYLRKRARHLIRAARAPGPDPDVAHVFGASEIQPHPMAQGTGGTTRTPVVPVARA